MADAMRPTLPRPVADGFGAIRNSARKRFLARGWPTRRDEAYKYTDLSSLARDDWPRAPRPASTPELPAALGVRSLWVDGHPDDRKTGADARVRQLHACAAAPAPELAALLGRLAPADDPVVALNTALFDHGAWISLPDDTASADPIELAYVSGERTTAAGAHARLALAMGRNSSLVLIERHAGSAAETLATRVAEISLAAGAQLLHIRLNQAGISTRLLGCTAVHVAAGARYRYLGLDLGGKLTRESLRVVLAGTESGADLAGLALLDGRRHADADVLVEHTATHTRSRQLFRGVLDGHCRGAYTGRVRVAPGAQKSDAAQESANLLLSPHAEADTRPQLEIYADDVACSHGAATGAIDPEALYYLQSRGIGAAAARRMIAYGFAAQVLAGVRGTAWHRPLAALLAEHMQTAAEVREWL